MLLAFVSTPAYSQTFETKYCESIPAIKTYARLQAGAISADQHADAELSVNAECGPAILPEELRTLVKGSFTNVVNDGEVAHGYIVMTDGKMSRYFYMKFLQVELEPI